MTLHFGKLCIVKDMITTGMPCHEHRTTHLYNNAVKRWLSGWGKWPVCLL